MSLRVEELKKHFGGLVAVKGATFEARRGEILGLVGPNGAGKTTIFNMISGLVKPTGGRAYFEGHALTGLSMHQIARLGIGRTFQHTRIFHHMTVLENVMLAGPRINDGVLRAMLSTRHDRARWAEAAMEALESVGIAHQADEYGGDLSYAEQKLVMFACLVASGAKAYLLDEPTAGLDPNSQRTMIEAVRRLGGPDRTMILIEHNLDVVRGCCERVVFLAQGEVLATGSPREVEDDPALRDPYFGSGAA